MLLRQTRAVTALVVLLFASPAAAQSKRAITIDDVIDLVQLSAPRISPDGRRVLYTVSEVGKWKDNKRVTSIWIVDADGAGPRRFLAHEKDRAPAWSPDGRFVAFLAERENPPGKESDGSVVDIWIIPADGGEASKLSDHKGKIRAFEWTKDGGSIVFLADRVKTEAQKAAEKAGDDAIFVDEGPNGQERTEFSELWRIGVADRREQRITRDDTLLIESFRVAPDGRKVAINLRRENTRNGQNRGEIAVVDVASGAVTTVTRNDAPEQNVQWSPEGKVLGQIVLPEVSANLAFGGPDMKTAYLAGSTSIYRVNLAIPGEKPMYTKP